jgi:hypothetical protein
VDPAEYQRTFADGQDIAVIKKRFVLDGAVYENVINASNKLTILHVTIDGAEVFPLS